MPWWENAGVECSSFGLPTLIDVSGMTTRNGRLLNFGRNRPPPALDIANNVYHPDLISRRSIVAFR